MKKYSVLRLFSAVLTVTVTGRAYGEMVPFVLNYNSNTNENQSVSTNAAVNMLKGYSEIWTTGTAWNNGAPTAIGQPVMDASQAYSVFVTNNRTQSQADSAYFSDRRNQSYSAISGLGDLAPAFYAASGAFTTINSIPANALTGKYDDKGNGAGLTSSATVGKMVELINTFRGSNTSSNPSKAYFNSPRPWRLTDSSLVVTSGPESVGYYTSTLADGSPNTSTALTYFPAYDTNVKIVPALLPVRSTTPATDGGFVSGHTNAVYLASFALAYATPERYQELMLSASSLAHDRIVAGMHTPLDVIGGRMLATALSASKAYESVNDNVLSQARAQGAALAASNGTLGRFDRLSPQASADFVANKDLYTFRMTYGLPTIHPTDLPAVVPLGAESLLETRLPYLTVAQRREVLRTTAIPSGHAVIDDEEGWGRLNYFAASAGYGRFDSDVSVTMDAALGGLHARDVWQNPISGPGKLTKQGTGQLGLTGLNTFTGGVDILGGTLIAASGHALGSGNVTVSGGSLAVYTHSLHITGNLSVQGDGTLEMIFENGMESTLSVDGALSLDGTLLLTFVGSSLPALHTPILLIDANGGLTGGFDQVLTSGLPGGLGVELTRTIDGLQMTVVPEPSTGLILAGASLLLTRRTRRRG